jgi:hypothetical protein
MLPKLARIHSAGTLVFIIATNNISRFDLAIRRRGRFDRLAQVMPPTAVAKLQKADWGKSKNVDIKKKFDELSVPFDEEVKKHLASLTFGECNSYANELAGVSDPFQAANLLRDAFSKGTMNSKAGVKSDGSEEKWVERCQAEAHLTT